MSERSLKISVKLSDSLHLFKKEKPNILWILQFGTKFAQQKQNTRRKK